MAEVPDRPLRADARRNREKVLRAAQEAFAEHGMGVPLDEIAGRAGVGPGTVYRHFPTKEALFEAVVAARMQDLITAARAGPTRPTRARRSSASSRCSPTRPASSVTSRMRWWRHRLSRRRCARTCGPRSRSC
ncbi:TetR/AcrR family transcriptional regulator [Pseudonocardia benzenivorans]